MNSEDWELSPRWPESTEAYRSGDTVSPGAYKELMSNVVILLDHVQPLPSSDSGESLWYIRLDVDHPAFTPQ